VGGLPPSAYRHRAWWADDVTHVEARAWLELGRRVEEVNLERQIVQFSYADRPAIDNPTRFTLTA
jgi:hypothetical protein